VCDDGDVAKIIVLHELEPPTPFLFALAKKKRFWIPKKKRLFLKNLPHVRDRISAGAANDAPSVLPPLPLPGLCLAGWERRWSAGWA